MALVATGLALLVCGPARAEPSLAAIDPPTIETVTIAARGPSAIEGEGTPGSLVRLTSDGRALGEARVANDRRWRVVVAGGFAPGVHQIEAVAAAEGTETPVPGDEIRVSVPAVLGATAVVAYEGARDEAAADETRRRAEGLAQAAGEAFDTVGPGKDRGTTGTGSEGDGQRPDPAPGNTGAGPGDSALAVVVDWLKRSARAYRAEIVDRLAVPGPGPGDTGTAPPKEDVSAAEAARRIAEDRRRAEEDLARRRKAEADRRAAEAKMAEDDRLAKEAAARRAAEDLATRKADADRKIAEALKDLETARREAQAKKAEDDRLAKEAAARRAAEDLALRKADADRKIAEALKDLELARREADAKAAALRDAAAEPPPATPAPPAQPTITLKPFRLPGDRVEDERRPVVAEVDVDKPVPHARRLKRPRRAGASRCQTGRVVMRKGRRWYVTGEEDTLWHIAERFYGSGLAYPRLYRANRKRLSSPHVVRPCLALRLPHRRR